ncbi:dapper homolog 3-like [Hetaerina americana]|uniref:dapper homolog 3-like n=1 Tax=Hetaerina americana TaxID=62018 RepID=UPI003A7F611A
MGDPGGVRPPREPPRDTRGRARRQPSLDTAPASASAPPRGARRPVARGGALTTPGPPKRRLAGPHRRCSLLPSAGPAPFAAASMSRPRAPPVAPPEGPPPVPRVVEAAAVVLVLGGGAPTRPGCFPFAVSGAAHVRLDRGPRPALSLTFHASDGAPPVQQTHAPGSRRDTCAGRTTAACLPASLPLTLHPTTTTRESPPPSHPHDLSGAKRGPPPRHTLRTLRPRDFLAPPPTYEGGRARALLPSRPGQRIPPSPGRPPRHTAAAAAGSPAPPPHFRHVY